MKELCLRGSLFMEGPAKLSALRLRRDPRRLLVTDARPTGDELLDAALSVLAESAEKRTPSYWVSHLGARVSKLLGAKALSELLTSRLVACGAVTLGEGSSRLRWLKLKSSREIRIIPSDPARRAALVSRLRLALQASAVGDPRDRALIALVHACRIRDVFKGHDLREARKQIKDMVKADPIAWAVSRAVASEMAADGGAVVVV